MIITCFKSFMVATILALGLMLKYFSIHYFHLMNFCGFFIQYYFLMQHLIAYFFPFLRN